MAKSIDLKALLAESGVGELLDELDRELVGLVPVKTRIREIASLLVVDTALAALGVAGAMFVIGGIAAWTGWSKVPKKPLERTRKRLETDVRHLKEHIA